jgi:hypothetical protein
VVHALRQLAEFLYARDELDARVAELTLGAPRGPATPPMIASSAYARSDASRSPQTT